MATSRPALCGSLLSQARQTESPFELGGALAVGQEATLRDAMDAVRQESGR